MGLVKGAFVLYIPWDDSSVLREGIDSGYAWLRERLRTLTDSFIFSKYKFGRSSVRGHWMELDRMRK
jgi:hypothetical protein